MTAATEKIELTRAQLRRAMTPPPPAPRKNYSRVKLEGQGPTVLDRLKALPFIGTIVDAIDSWWLSHPLRPVTRVVGQASNAAVRPFARTNPISLVAGAAIAGAALAWSRPWRWLIRPALFAGLVPQIASRLVARIPLESWMAGLDNTDQTMNRT
jgi:hypothetical protein